MSDEVSPAVAPAEEQQPGPVVQEKQEAAARAPLVVAAVVGLVVGAGAVGAAWAASSSSGGSTAPKAATFTMGGQLDLAGDTVPTGSDNTKCEGTGGYSDISDGTPVTVYDAAGTVVAQGSLQAGTYADSSNLSGDCLFPFRVSGVPVGPRYYQVEISHRGKVTYSAQEARAGNIAAKLGH